MSRIRVISDGEIVGSIERDTGYHGQAAAHFRLADGSLLAFAYERYQVDDNRRPIANIDMGSADAGSWLIEVFLQVPPCCRECLAQLPSWEAVRPKRIIDLG